jgi:hypothetical protein
MSLIGTMRHLAALRFRSLSERSEADIDRQANRLDRSKMTRSGHR